MMAAMIVETGIKFLTTGGTEGHRVDLFGWIPRVLSV
jgi:hypothetical protein